MKKLSVIFLVIALFLLCACSGNKNPLYDLNRETYTSQNLEIVTEKETYSSDDTVIKYTITNVGNTESGINSSDNCFELHKLEDGQWKRVGTKVDHFWTEMALLLMPGDTFTRTIDLDAYFYLPLEKGEYRISIEGLVSNTFEVS